MVDPDSTVVGLTVTGSTLTQRATISYVPVGQWKEQMHQRSPTEAVNRPRRNPSVHFLMQPLPQEIYWRIALLAYDEPSKTLRAWLREYDRYTKTRRAITFAAPKKVFFWESG